MGSISTTAGLQVISDGLRRLQGTEVSSASLIGAIGVMWSKLVASANALSVKLTPEPLLTVDSRIRIEIVAQDQVRLHTGSSDGVSLALSEERREATSLADQLAASCGGVAASAIISVSERAALVKRVPVSSAVRGRKLTAALDYLLELESPFTRDQVLWAYRCGGSSQRGQKPVELAIVPRSVVDPVIVAAQSCGAHVSEIQFQPNQPSDDAIRVATYPTPAERRRRSLCALLGVAALVEVAALGFMPFMVNAIRQEQLIRDSAELNKTATELAAERAELEKTLKPIDAALANLQALPSPVATLELLQEELGRQTFLERVSLRGRNIQLSGSSEDLAAMVERIEKSRSLKPRSITSNGKAAGQQSEKFTLSLEISETP